ncbi:hypothetical protein CANARDRAFT_173697 [[Candida] arabinofermentans NRRL YB-2248]|uniref:Uncharacterized protein n=1 Tax=[Candida] arabinofermentans NRRL YB-2248 TaxID=983967 RepID=A0A1E4T7R3_9ASCO|nr:hypothetical protein CANARDRAFT_173697 [[Candida] arabinofermentans NRRL YB-2248]
MFPPRVQQIYYKPHISNESPKNRNRRHGGTVALVEKKVREKWILLTPIGILREGLLLLNIDWYNKNSTLSYDFTRKDYVVCSTISIRL